MTAESMKRSDIDVVLQGQPPSVTEARHLAVGLARELGADEHDVGLAVSEAVGNAVVHAFVGRQPGTIRLQAGQRRERMVVTVSDNGIGMKPNLDSPGLGMGVSLITRSADEVRFDTTSGGTTVSMGFLLDPRRIAAQDSRRAI